MQRIPEILALPLVVTWLLDDHTIGCRRTSIERYAEEAGLAVVMPNAHRSFYCDMAYGGGRIGPFSLKNCRYG